MEEREMKKIYLFIVTLITCSLITLFVACEKDEEIDLTTISVSNEQFTPSYTSATLQCSFATKATLRNVYVQYATTHDFAEYNEMEMSKSDDVYLIVLDSLQDNTTYYVRYAVSNRYSSAITEEISTFQTLQPSVPTITLKSISDIWDTHAKAQIALEFDGGSQISEMGICWNTQPAPVVENNKQTTKDTVVALEIKDLQPNTRYFVRSYAVNKVGVAYSEEYEFTTFSLPEIKTEEMTDVQLTTAMLHGTLVFNGNDTAAIKGFCWSTNEDPTVENNHIEIDTASAMYTYRLSNLIDKAQYYVRAYAKNKIGIVYGESKSFTTQSALPPAVTTSSVANITYTSATIGGNVTNDGGTTISERGVVYSTSQNPTISNSKVTSGSGIGSFSCSLSNLQDGTIYYIRAYAINRKGASYGEQKSFTTKTCTLPSVTTSSVTNVSYISAVVSGNVTSDGGTTITERGVVYSTNQNPTISNRKVTSGSATYLDSFSCQLNSLQGGTTYYVRAYATNKKGTAYGEQKSFTTEVIKTISGTENGYGYVDLGLSVKWATKNVGASKPEDHGYYFAWGETHTEFNYDWPYYDWCDGTYNSLTKYNNFNNYGIVDDKTQLELRDDAASTIWGGAWRMPTYAELTELITNCTWIGTSQNGVYGCKVTSNINGHSIFLPETGYREDGSLCVAKGWYWSSSLCTGVSFNAWCIEFHSDNVKMMGYVRCRGQAVRPVCP